MPAPLLSCPRCHTRFQSHAESRGTVNCPECGFVLPAEMSGWFYVRDRRKVGPVSLKEIRRLARLGAIRPSDMVLQPGTAKWATASSIEGVILPVAKTLGPVSTTGKAEALSHSVPSSSKGGRGQVVRNEPQPVPVVPASLNKAQRFWILIGGKAEGPWSVEEIRARIGARQLTWDMLACPEGNRQWTPLGQQSPFRLEPSPTPVADHDILEVIPDAVPTVKVAGARAATQPSYAVESPRSTTNGSSPTGGVGWLKGGGAAILGLILMMFVRVWMRSNKPAPVPPRASPAIMRPTTSSPAQWNLPPADARINVTATDGTTALQELVSQLPPDQVRALGLSVWLTGVDVYALKVRITNTGTTPIRIFPSNLHVHFGEQTVGVTTANHSVLNC